MLQVIRKQESIIRDKTVLDVFSFHCRFAFPSKCDYKYLWQQNCHSLPPSPVYTYLRVLYVMISLVNYFSEFFYSTKWYFIVNVFENFMDTVSWYKPILLIFALIWVIFLHACLFLFLFKQSIFRICFLISFVLF